MVNLYLAAGISPNTIGAFDQSALMEAATDGQLQIVQTLLQAGADVNYSDRRGGSALEIAARNGHVDIVRRLLAAGARIDIPDLSARGDGFAGPILLAAVASDDPLILKTLKKHGKLGEKEYIDVSRLPDYEVLRHPYVQRRTRIVRDLIAAGADVNVADERFKITPLMAAAMYNYQEVVELLLAHGAKADTERYDGKTALSAAASQGHANIIQILLKAGAKKNIGQALVTAAKQGHEKAVRVLLSAGPSHAAIVSARTQAMNSGHSEIAELLRSHDGRPR